MMPWFTIPYEDNASRSQLTTLFGIQGIPSLILLNPDGSVITEDGRGEVNDDPEGTVKKKYIIFNRYLRIYFVKIIQFFSFLF